MLTADYIVGLVDGEGSFTAYVRDLADSKEKVRRVRIEPRFYLKLTERDKLTLDELRIYFRCGNVYFQKDIRPNHQNCYRFEVTSRKDLAEIIIPFFREHPLRLPSKKKDFGIFCKLIQSIQKGEHLTSAGLRKLFTWKQKMH
ncbi:MAG: LAGLIDADG family homing endonuclease [Candidatus Liptonbacteria bacterium]|nr:LAGLIDADG family homing endonuclease [Candidatus Liptonbacteria bacterium]